MTIIMTIVKFVAFLRESVSGTSMVTVNLDSPMDGKGKMRKRNNPYHGHGIVKRMILNGVVGYSYGNAINRIASKEGKDERDAKRHPWGDMDTKRLFRTHRFSLAEYLSMKVENTTVIGYFLPCGKQLTDSQVAELKQFVPVKTKSSSQADLEGEVIARDFGMVNVRSVKFKSQLYQIVETMPETETDGEKETVTA